MDLSHISTRALEIELQKRGKHTTEGRCPTCHGKWPMIYKHYAARGLRWHCVGCNNLIENCTCR